MAFTVALLQIESFGLDQNRNRDKGLKCCRDAKSMGADLILFPELWNIGCAPCPVDPAGRRQWTASAIDRDSPFFQRFVDLAKEFGVNIAITYLEAHLPKPRNTVSVINHGGEVVLNHSKVFLCDFGEAELGKPAPDLRQIGCDVNCSPGNSFDVCTLNGAEDQVTVGAMICADREFPEAATQLILNGAELIVVPNACTWDDIRTAGLKTRAFDNMVAIAMANYPGPRAGSSQAYTCVAWRDGNPQDTLVGRAGEKEEILLVRFDIGAIREFRKEESWRMDYRRRTRRTFPCSLPVSCVSRQPDGEQHGGEIRAIRLRWLERPAARGANPVFSWYVLCNNLGESGLGQEPVVLRVAKERGA